MFPAVPLAVAPWVGAFIGAAIPATIAAAVAVYLNAVGRKREDVQRRRGLYSEAYKLAMEWCEAIYRVRRRAPDGSQDRALVEHFHDLQERIAYYQGWLGIEAADLGRSYQQFLDKVLEECKPLIQEAWLKPGREPTEPTLPDEPAAHLDAPKERFLREAREHLSPWWRRRIKPTT